MADPPFTLFHEDQVSLRLHPKFLSNMDSPFHLNQSIHLPTVYPILHASLRVHMLHSLDICHALAFYPQCIHTFQVSPRLFLTIAEHCRGRALSSQCLSKWISHCIVERYILSHVCSSPGVTADSTRAQASTSALLADVPWQNICRAARWSSIHTLLPLTTQLPQQRRQMQQLTHF